MNVRSTTIKLLQENVHVNLFDLGLGNSFLDMTPKAQATKREKKRQNLDFIKIFVLKKTLSRK